jgi:hypothetical protein
LRGRTCQAFGEGERSAVEVERWELHAVWLIVSLSYASCPVQLNTGALKTWSFGRVKASAPKRRCTLLRLTRVYLEIPVESV